MGTRIKKFNELTNELQKTIRDAQEKLLKAILDDTEISKVEKLQLISDNSLFKTDPYICDVFSDSFGKEYNDILKEKGVTHPVIDDYFHMQEYQRHEVVNLADIVENIDGYDNELITIFSNRRTNDIFTISKYEFIDAVYEWCVKNKTIAFELDW